MRILISNIRIDKRTGTELIVGEVALGLRARGHEVLLYSPTLGSHADVLRGHGLVIADTVEQLTSFAPDIIHGHHNVSTGLAMLACPGVPAIWFCHDMTTWHDRPFACAGIARYVAHSEQVETLFRSEPGIDPKRIRRVPNAVDTAQFLPKGEAPRRLRRAIAFAKYDSRATDILRAACAAKGIEVTLAGPAFGNPVDDVAALIASHDIVFGYGRIALEAIASNRPIICLEGSRAAGLVTGDVFDSWASRNFGTAILSYETTIEFVESEIDLYNCEDFKQLRERVLDEIALTRYLDQVEALHKEALADHAPRLEQTSAHLAAMFQDQVHSYAPGRVYPGVVNVEKKIQREQLEKQFEHRLKSLARFFRFQGDGRHVESLRFDFCSPGAYLLSAGWLPAESWGVWSVGKKATLIIPARFGLATFEQLQVVGWLHLAVRRGKRGHIRLSVTVGNNATTRVFERDGETEVAPFSIDCRSQHADGEDAIVTFEIEDELDRGQQDRGVGLRSMAPIAK